MKLLSGDFFFDTDEIAGIHFRDTETEYAWTQVVMKSGHVFFINDPEVIETLRNHVSLQTPEPA